MVDAVPNFRESPLFTLAEKAAMRLADAMAGDHKHAPFDEIFAELRKHYSEEQIQKTLAREMDELRRREAAYRDGRPLPDLKGKTVILVDDGLATGASMQAAARAVRRHEPARIVIAVPVASRATCDPFRAEVDEVVCAITPAPFYAVGNWYEDFSQTMDEEVRELLERAAEEKLPNAGRDSD